MKTVLWFREITTQNSSQVGMKSTAVAEMFNLGLSVPSGFVITAQAYASFLASGIGQKIELLLQNVDLASVEQREQVSQKIQRLMLNTPLSEELVEEIKNNYELLGASRRKASDLLTAKDVSVAVRSSPASANLAVASVGHQRAFLHVQGSDQVVRSVQVVWASLFSPTALYYRVKNNIRHTAVLLPIIIQKMVQAEQSGSLFTTNPSSRNSREMLISAIHGSGELFGQGLANPDYYVVDKQTRELKKMELHPQEVGIFRNAAGQQERRKISPELQARKVLPDSYIQELARLGKKLEEYYHVPQDVEWVTEQGNVFLVQTRPAITFTSAKQEEEE